MQVKNQSSNIVERGEIKYFLEPCLRRTLDLSIERVKASDSDSLMIIDGEEGSGKSVFAFQIAKYLDPNFNLGNVAMNGVEFEQAIIRAKPHSCIVFDEAFHGLSSRTSLSKLNKVLVQKMMECRQKNLFLLVVLPSFFMLDRYVALFRARGLLHVYTNSGRRGYWLGFNRKNKKLLYLIGRKTMSYSYPRIYNFKGRFYGVYAIDEQAYRKKKLSALENFDEEQISSSTLDRYKAQRDMLLNDFMKRNKLSLRKAEEELKRIGFIDSLSLSYHQIMKICEQFKPKHSNVT